MQAYDFDKNRVLSIQKVSEMLGISTSTLRKQCAKGEGPKIIRLSARRIGIRVKDLDFWFAQQNQDQSEPRIH
jgi:predicted DNA-binding transcriptional regulator AlpA